MIVRARELEGALILPSQHVEVRREGKTKRQNKVDEDGDIYLEGFPDGERRDVGRGVPSAGGVALKASGI